MRPLSLAVVLCLLPVALARGADERFAALPPGRLKPLLKKPCTLVYAWSMRCSSCLGELPDLLQKLGTLKGVTPLVLDLSSPEQQEGFSRGYLEALAPAFPTFRAIPTEGDAYRGALDREWNGRLPYAALFHRGKRRQAWSGGVDLGGLEADVATHCARRPQKLR